MIEHIQLLARDPSPVSDRQLVHFGRLTRGRWGLEVAETLCGQVGRADRAANGVTCGVCIGVTSTVEG